MIKYAYQLALLGLASSELMAIIKLRNDREKIVPRAEARIALLKDLVRKAKSGNSTPQAIRQELEEADKIAMGGNLTKSLEDLIREIEQADLNLVESRKQQLANESESQGQNPEKTNKLKPLTTRSADERKPKPSSYM